MTDSPTARGADDLPRLTVALTFDHDSISDGVRRGDPPVKFIDAASALDGGVVFDRLDRYVERWARSAST